MRRFYALALVLLLCTPAFAGAQKGVQVSVPRVQFLHPLVLGRLADMNSPISRTVAWHAAALAQLDRYGGLTPAQAAGYLAPMREGTPLERAAAGVIARALTRPEELAAFLAREPFQAFQPLGRLPRPSQPRDGGEAWATLWRLASENPAVPALFDGVPEYGDLYLDGLAVTQGELTRGGQRIQELGRGGYGIVDAHDKAEGVVLKTPLLRDKVRGLDQLREDAAKDDILTQRLAAAGLGPRGFGVSEAAGVPVVGKERVYGENVGDLISDARYGRREHGLVLELIDRMASRRTMISDLREPNIMIGVSLAETEGLRAWLIDGQALRTVENVPAPEIKRRLLETPTIRGDWKQDEEGKVTGTHLPFLEVLERGLVASGAAGLWTRLKYAFRDRRNGPPPPTSYAFPDVSHETPITRDGFVPPPSPSSAPTPR